MAGIRFSRLLFARIMLPKGTLVLLAAGLMLLAAGYGIAFLLTQHFNPAPFWMRLPVLLVIGFGAVLFVMGGFSVAVGISDALRKRGRKD
jgi:hypothetical protein